MKTLTEDKTSKKYKDLVALILDKHKATYLGAGDNSVELKHAETLANYNFSCIIPIHKIKVLSQGLGYIVMENAEQLTADEKTLIKRTISQAEAYLLDDDEEALKIFLKAPKLLEFLTGIKTAYTRAGLDIEEIDYSADNLMNYKGKFVMVDL